MPCRMVPWLAKLQDLSPSISCWQPPFIDTNWTFSSLSTYQTLAFSYSFPLNLHFHLLYFLFAQLSVPPSLPHSLPPLSSLPPQFSLGSADLHFHMCSRAALIPPSCGPLCRSSLVNAQSCVTSFSPSLLIQASWVTLVEGHIMLLIGTLDVIHPFNWRRLLWFLLCQRLL